MTLVTTGLLLILITGLLLYVWLLVYSAICENEDRHFIKDGRVWVGSKSSSMSLTKYEAWRRKIKLGFAKFILIFIPLSYLNLVGYIVLYLLK